MANTQFNLVTNRTAADVERWRELKNKTLKDESGNVTARGWAALTDAEKTEWLSGCKGSYNYTDLNRVESVIAYLATLLSVKGITTKTNWKNSDVPTKSDMERYLSNIQTIKANTGLGTAIVLPSTMNNLTWKTANMIEKLLEELIEWAEGYAVVQYYCGDAFLYCGGEL